MFLKGTIVANNRLINDFIYNQIFQKTPEQPKNHVLQQLYITLVDWILIKNWPTFSTRWSALPTADQVQDLCKALPRLTQIFCKHSDFVIRMMGDWQVSYFKVSIGSKFVMNMKTELYGLVYLSSFRWQCYGKYFVLLLKLAL